MKIYLFLISFLLSRVTFGQTERVSVPGTKCSIIPPAGFTAAKSFSGFQDESTGTSIMINELPMPYLSIIEGFTAEALRSKGMIIKAQQTIDFNNGKADWFTIEQSANGMVYIKQILVFGDKKQTIIVNGIYPEESKSVATSVRQSLLSTVYNEAKHDKPLEAVSFSIDVDNSPFKLVKYLSGSLFYSVEGKIPTSEATFIAGQSISKVVIEDRKAYAQVRFKMIPGIGSCQANEVNEINIDSLSGYEIIAICNTEGNTSELIYQIILFEDSGDYYILLGLAKAELEKYRTAFQQIAKTFKRK